MLLRRIARPLLAGIFITGGINALRDAEEHAKAAQPVVDRFGELVPVQELPSTVTLVRLDAGVKIGAGTLLALGKVPRLSAAALAGSLVPSTLAGHRFWEMNDPEQRRLHQIEFVKNLGLLGGLLLAVADTEGKPSLAWRARRAGRTSAATAELIHRDLTSGLGRLSKRVGEVSETAAETAGKVRGQAALTAGRVGGQASDTAGRLTEQASEVAGRLTEQASEVAGRVGEQAAETASRLGEQAAVVAGQASERATAVAGRVGERLSEQIERLLAEAEHLRAEAEKQAALVAKRARIASKRSRRRAGKRIDRLNRRADKRIKRATKRAEQLRATLPKEAAKRAEQLRATLPKEAAKRAERLRVALPAGSR